MHPEVIENNNVPCPECGMSLDRVDISLPFSNTKYVCPMHPEIVVVVL
jgi:Cu+-exporting ATPase